MPKKRPGAKAGQITERESQDFIVRTMNQAVKQRDRGKSKVPPHIRLELAVMNSKAWLALSCPARVVYLEFLKIELEARWKGRDKNRLELSYSWIKKTQGIHEHAAARAFIELEALGFIMRPKSEERGGLFGRVNIYRLSTAWQGFENDGAGLAKAKAQIADYDKKHKQRRPTGFFKSMVEKIQAKPLRRIRKSPEGKNQDLEIGTAAASLKRRLQNTRTLLEKEGERTN